MEKGSSTSHQYLSSADQTLSVIKLFQKSDPLSILGKSIYRKDYQSILGQNWLRTQAITSLINILEHNFSSKLSQMIKQEKYLQHEIKIMTDLENNLGQYIKVLDPFVVLMILSSQDDFILQTLFGLEIFNPNTKYVIFPMNTDTGVGSHWFLSIFKNPRYQTTTNPQKTTQNYQLSNSELFILNSISTSKQDYTAGMVSQLSRKIPRLFQLFHPQYKILKQIPAYFIKRVTLQTNGFDCGILTVAYIEEFMLNLVLGVEIQRILKLKLWINKSLVKEQIHSELTLDSQFILLQSSSYLRKKYQQLLERFIIEQNS